MAEQSTSEIAEPSLEEVLAWAGHRLDEVAGGNVGKVEGAYVDAESGRPEWLLSRMGRFGHYCLVPARDAVCGVGHVWVPYTRDQIRRAPKIEPKDGLTREKEALGDEPVDPDQCLLEILVRRSQRGAHVALP